MDNVLGFFSWIENAKLTIFVFLTIFNVGITRTLEDFIKYKKVGDEDEQ